MVLAGKVVGFGASSQQDDPFKMDNVKGDKNCDRSELSQADDRVILGWKLESGIMRESDIAPQVMTENQVQVAQVRPLDTGSMSDWPKREYRKMMEAIVLGMQTPFPA